MLISLHTNKLILCILTFIYYSIKVLAEAEARMSEGTEASSGGEALCY